MRDDVGHLQSRLTETIKAIGYVAENGDSIAILSVKKGMAHHMATLLKLKCQVPNPSHKLNIQLQPDPLLVSKILPATGRILIDGIPHQQPHQQPLQQSHQQPHQQSHQQPMLVNGTHSPLLTSSHNRLVHQHSSNHATSNLNHSDSSSLVRMSHLASTDTSVSG